LGPLFLLFFFFSFLFYFFFSFLSWAYRAGGGARGPAASPSLLGKQSQSGNIRFTVWQYWLIIKINGTNSVNFVGNMYRLF
jgi:hypothetical protein